MKTTKKCYKDCTFIFAVLYSPGHEGKRAADGVANPWHDVLRKAGLVHGFLAAHFSLEQSQRDERNCRHQSPELRVVDTFTCYDSEH
eukprot:477276-Hanusia_phi.AAC.3